MRGRGRKVRRLVLVGVAGIALGGATALTLYAIGDKITYAPSPSELAAGAVEPGSRIRLGGLVKDGSVERGENGRVSFAVTDTATDIDVTYVGILPDLFRYGPLACSKPTPFSPVTTKITCRRKRPTP